MSKKVFKTPGVYIEEDLPIPASVLEVPTSIPAFIGYTPQAELKGKDCAFVPTKINSFLEFQNIFCFPDGVEAVQQYSPQYYLVKQNSKPSSGDFILIGSYYYSIVPDAYSIYYMYNAVKLFYQNGGLETYIVSVGGYGSLSGTHLNIGEPLVNPNVLLADLLKGLEALRSEEEPTMYVCPEATLLSISENGTLMQQMLFQNYQMKKSISIFDIIGGNRQNSLGNYADIEAFRNHTGTMGLDYGAAYYPFIGTTIMARGDLDYTNLFGGDLSALGTVFSTLSPQEHETLDLLKSIYNSGRQKSIGENHRRLLALSHTYNGIISAVLELVNIMPASGGIAGVITRVDNERGVWKAPANVSMNGVTSLPIHIDNTEQEVLNIDAISGKSINAIRSFSGRGILVWGARTLAGNDNEWRYINVRRTMIFIEQSCKNACVSFIYDPNEPKTWRKMISSVSNFLITLWQKGAFAGSKPEEAFYVKCDSETMTSHDIQNGLLKVYIGVALSKPAEFIIISFCQQQEIAS